MGNTIFIEKKYIKDPKKYPFRIYSDLQHYISNLVKDKDGKIKCRSKKEDGSRDDVEIQEESIFYFDKDGGVVINLHYEDDDEKDYIFETHILNKLFFGEEKGKIKMIDSLKQNISSLFSFIKDHKLCDDITTNKLSSLKDTIIILLLKENSENERDPEIIQELEIFLKQLETYLKNKKTSITEPNTEKLENAIKHTEEKYDIYKEERANAKKKLISRLEAKKKAKAEAAAKKDGSKRKSSKRKSSKGKIKY